MPKGPQGQKRPADVIGAAVNYCKKVNLATATNAPEKAGDVWTWTALDADSKLIVSYFVCNRDGEHALEFVGDLGSRLVDRPQIITDGACDLRHGD